MDFPLAAIIADRIRADGPMTVAEYVELALYHPGHGYYASSAQRSGARGDFFTSVDLGPVFGELLAVQIAEMQRLLGNGPFDLVEAAAGNGRLSRDVLDHLERLAPEAYAKTRLHLVERSPAARAGQRGVLGRHAARLSTSGPSIPSASAGRPGLTGVIFANELLDALPPHLVVMREDGLREVMVGLAGGELVTVESQPSSERLQEYLDVVGARLEPGWFAEVNLAAAEWVRRAAGALDRGFLLLFDYGHEAADLYSGMRAAGTLTTFSGHASEPREGGPGWLREPGARDITAHVDLTGVRHAAEAEGLETLGIVDQAYFLLALSLAGAGGTGGTGMPGAATDPSLRRRLALKTLLLPGGLGSTHKAMVFGRAVGRPALAGLSRGGRLT